jgi:hypothetical protein
MLSIDHEGLIEFFRDQPSLAAELLTGPLGIAIPPFEAATLAPTEFNAVAPTEYRADMVITLTDGPAVVFAVVVEVQLKRDKGKQRSWPVYVATLHARVRCPVALLVMCPTTSVARYCGTPITVGVPGFVLTPLVVGPREVPLVTDPDEARRHPLLAVLSALAHGAEEVHAKPLAESVYAALDFINQDNAQLYTDLVWRNLARPGQIHLEALMTTAPYTFKSEFMLRVVAHGKAEGEAEAVLMVLEARGFTIPDELRARVTGCADEDQLRTWIRHAATAETLDEVF